MDFFFKTYFLILWGLIWGVAYCLILYFTERKNNINSLDFGAVWFSAISIIGGFKLIWLTFVTAKTVGSNFETDQIYAAYGGLCVVWISLRAIYIKVKR